MTQELTQKQAYEQLNEILRNQGITAPQLSKAIDEAEKLIGNGRVRDKAAEELKAIIEQLRPLITKKPDWIKRQAIFSKIARIQAQIKGIERTKENKFQGYKYFTEDKAILLLRPLLEKEGIAMTFSSSPDHFSQEKTTEGKKQEWVVRYLKVATISDGSDTLTFNFWAMGQDGDIAKAGGKAETYAVKYFLGKFWTIPVVDNLDPDQEKNKGETPETAQDIEEIRAANEKDGRVMTPEEKKQVNEFLKKHGFTYEKK